MYTLLMEGRKSSIVQGMPRLLLVRYIYMGVAWADNGNSDGLGLSSNATRGEEVGAFRSRHTMSPE